MSVHDDNKAIVSQLRKALSSCNALHVEKAIFDLITPNAKIKLQYPHGEQIGPGDIWRNVHAPLFVALPDLERRDFIFMAGPRWGEEKEGDWVGLGGNLVGNFVNPWLGIPSTGTPVFMRYHEYLRIEGNKVVEIEGLWDIPQIIVQAGVWPMGPQNGVEWMCPGPVNGLGILAKPHDPARAEASVCLVWRMLHEVQKGTSERPDVGLGHYWHDSALWYGPTGLGIARGHQDIATLIFKQFRDGLSNNIRHLDEGVFFGDGDFAAFTGWPSATALHSGDGFFGSCINRQDNHPPQSRLLAYRKRQDSRMLGDGRYAGFISSTWDRCIRTHGNI